MTSVHNIITRGDGNLSPRVLYLLGQPLLEKIIDHMATATKLSGNINEHTVMIDDGGNNVQVTAASPIEQENIAAYGTLLLTALDHSRGRHRRLRNIASRCRDGGYSTLEEVHLDMERHISATIYVIIIACVVAGLALLAALQR